MEAKMRVLENPAFGQMGIFSVKSGFYPVFVLDIFVLPTTTRSLYRGEYI
jgi:hypothetical protein